MGIKTGIKTGIEDSTGTENGIKTGTKAKALPYAEIEMTRILTDQPTISIATLSNVMSLSLKQIRYMLDKLKNKGLIFREGARRNGKWVVLNTTQHAPLKTIPPDKSANEDDRGIQMEFLDIPPEDQ